MKEDIIFMELKSINQLLIVTQYYNHAYQNIFKLTRNYKNKITSFESSILSK